MILRKALLTVALLAVGLTSVSTASAAVAPDVKNLKVTPAAFKPLASGGTFVTSGGANVTFDLLGGAKVNFTFKSEKSGKRSGGKCVAGKAKTKAKTCTITKTLPGSALLTGRAGPNDIRFSGRLGDKALPVGRYRLVAKAEGTAARSSYARFTIIK